MRLFRALTVSFLVAAGAITASHALQIRSKEAVVIPRHWSRVGLPSSEHLISLRIALPRPRLSELERHVYEVSDPAHNRYGMHLSKSEVERLLAPSIESLDAVKRWLDEHGIPEENRHRSPAKDWIKCTMPIGRAEQLLNTTYYVWRHAKDDRTLVRTLEYSLPEYVHKHIELIQPTTMFAELSKLKSDVISFSPAQGLSSADKDIQVVDKATGLSVRASCQDTITLACLAEIYNYTDFKPKSLPASKNKIGVTGYLDEFANLQNLQAFYRDQLPRAVGTSFQVELLNGGQNSQDPDEAGVEANLDVQFAFGVAFPTPGLFWSTGGSPPFIPDNQSPQNDNEPYVEWLDFVLSKESLPTVISSSYGDDEQTVPESYARHACAQFAQLAARGVSVIVSSGDFGVGGVGDGDDPSQQVCLSNDGKNRTEFIPVFPASCPFVTVVGGTTSFPEVAVSRFFSGGGFSNYFSRPSYQNDHVNAYLRRLAPGTYRGLFNPNGRAYPDVAAQCDHFRIFVGDTFGLVGGTSAASPTFAGVITLVNNARLSAGRPVLGFLNPFLYSSGLKALNDITVGNNAGCGTLGFNATLGWDPVTGLGSPNFHLLSKL